MKTRVKTLLAHVLTLGRSKPQYVSVDVPATTIETDVTSDRYNGGQPAIKLVTFPEKASEPDGVQLTRCENGSTLTRS